MRHQCWLIFEAEEPQKPAKTFYLINLYFIEFSKSSRIFKWMGKLIKFSSCLLRSYFWGYFGELGFKLERELLILFKLKVAQFKYFIFMSSMLIHNFNFPNTLYICPIKQESYSNKNLFLIQLISISLYHTNPSTWLLFTAR